MCLKGQVDLHPCLTPLSHQALRQPIPEHECAKQRERSGSKWKGVGGVLGYGHSQGRAPLHIGPLFFNIYFNHGWTEKQEEDTIQQLNKAKEKFDCAHRIGFQDSQKKKRFLRAHKEPQLKRETKKIKRKKLGRVRIRCELRGFSGVEWMSGELLSWRLWIPRLCQELGHSHHRLFPLWGGAKRI